MKIGNLLDYIRNKFRKNKGQQSLSSSVRSSFIISLLLHAALVLVAGGFVISHVFLNREATFTGQPPPMKSYEPQKLEFKVKVSQQQRSSSRPAVMPRLSAAKTSDISLPEVKMDPKLVQTSFQPKFKPVSGMGMGAGLGTGYGSGGFGQGVSNFDFFGIKGKGEKIAVLVDVSVSMVEDDKGGIAGFVRVKERVNSVIDALKEGTMFNMVVFADAASVWKDGLVVANNENKAKAKEFIANYNSSLQNLGLSSGNISEDPKGLASNGGTTRLDLALSASFHQGVDTILVVTDGKPKVVGVLTADQIAAANAQNAKWQSEHPPETETGSNPPKVVKVWVPPQPARPARPPSKKPPKEGEPPDMGEPARPAVEGHWEERVVTDNRRPAPKPPPPLKPQEWTLNDFLKHLKLLYEAYYQPKGIKPPVIHCIGYQIDKDGDDFLRGITKEYKGIYRSVRSLKQ